jgi:hypothetical protein
MAGSAATALASGSWSVFVNILRFMISHYFVTITGMLVSLYLIVYSLFGMSCFSSVGLFKTIGLVDIFIRETTTPTSSSAISENCETDNWHYTQKTISTIFHNIVNFMFKFLYIGLIILILLFSSKEYFHKIAVDKIDGKVSASPTSFFKWGLISTNMFTIFIILCFYYLYNYKTDVNETRKNTVNIAPIYKKKSKQGSPTQENDLASITNKMTEKAKASPPPQEGTLTLPGERAQPTVEAVADIVETNPGKPIQTADPTASGEPVEAVADIAETNLGEPSQPQVDDILTTARASATK